MHRYYDHTLYSFPLYTFLWPEDSPQWPKHVVASVINRIKDSCVWCTYPFLNTQHTTGIMHLKINWLVFVMRTESLLWGRNWMMKIIYMNFSLQRVIFKYGILWRCQLVRLCSAGDRGLRIEHWQSDSDGEIPKCWDEDLSHCNCVRRGSVDFCPRGSLQSVDSAAVWQSFYNGHI